MFFFWYLLFVRSENGFEVSICLGSLTKLNLIWKRQFQHVGHELHKILFCKYYETFIQNYFTGLQEVGKIVFEMYWLSAEELWKFFFKINHRLPFDRDPT